ncbi:MULTISPECIES: D-alanyl-D-alanine carboxypeptidase/D-alanyl-D-alanine-endopeptidase [Janibacter]|uniref:D-alanyl-D-alanine carboxypeptidase/D-alanyl-D-alanine endopeptidase n=1 Tax=Janibacter TaxID=53457 RepID=UPI00082EFC7F|nr:D-alanyl-D-alanine carboxypeptidase/D-alanyl-D-alanine-endopeptidase [Janibacter terrae]HCA84271.1 D-alanyl-D-alanine carboxypeptidase/D-alanyl-D-alanine-endopeptidase [Streptomyces sp.]
MRRTLIAVTSVAALVVGYGAADAYDRVPGVLTIDEPVSQQAPEPVDVDPVLPPASTEAPAPTEGGLATALRSDLEDQALGSRVGIVVRDALTDEVLLARGEDRAQTPASTAKLLTAAAVAERADLSRVMTTEVVQGEGDELVLVASGDTMLAPGHGDPTQVEGRAGLADLAEEVAASLGTKGAQRHTLRLDATYAAGERYAPTWDMADVAAGYTQGVTMIGLAGERPIPFRASPRYPERSVLTAFAKALKAEGVKVSVDDSASTWRRPAPQGAEALGAVDSAPLGDVLALALDDSDNALTENVARQTAVADGAGASFAQVAGWVQSTLEGAGVDLTGVRLKDSCGLSSGQVVPARVISDVMQLGITGSATTMTQVLSELPVAGLTGTLHDRFHTDDTRSAAGVARAKTGTLTGTSALAGTTTTAEGRLLTYVVVADRVPSTTGTLGARAALDRVVADITACGCR